MSTSQGWNLRVENGLAFDVPELNALSTVWSDKARLAGGLPARDAFDAESLKPFLRHVAIVERAVHPTGRMSYRYRFFGHALAQRFGEQTGQFIEMSIAPDRLRRWIATYDAVLEESEPKRLVSMFESARLSYREGESFLAPLANFGRKPNAVLGGTYFSVNAALESA